jgi:hypothetical protein
MIETILFLLAAIGGLAGGVRFVKGGERGLMLRFETALRRNGEYRGGPAGPVPDGAGNAQDRASMFAGER